MTPNVKKCAVVACNEDKVDPVNFKWKWGEDELPIVDQYTRTLAKRYRRTALGMHTWRK